MPADAPITLRLVRCSIRHALAWLIVAVLTPALALAFAFGAWNIHLQAAATDQGLQNTARALSLAIDRDVGSILSALTTLASSPYLDSHEFRRFHEQALAATLPFGGWVVLTDRVGQQVVNTKRSFGDPLPTASAPDTIARVFRDARPVVSDRVYGKVAADEIVFVAVPVFRDGIVVYCVDTAFTTGRFSELLAEHELPDRWFASLIDDAGVRIARSLDAERFADRPPPLWFVEGTRGRTDGLLQGHGNAGYDIRVAFHRSRFTGWTAAIAAPMAVMTEARDRLLFTAAAGSLACMAFAFAIGMIAERKISAMVQSWSGQRIAATRSVYRGWRTSRGS